MTTSFLCSRRLVSALALLTVGILCMSAEGANVKLAIRYIPIGAETLTGVTPEGIETDGDRTEISGRREVTEFLELLATASPTAQSSFSRKRVRIKITQIHLGKPSSETFVDNEGVVREQGRDRQLSQDALMRIRELIESSFRKGS
jgi:hypothetical protein